VHQERQALLELLETLTPEQWDTPSLCTRWRVRDVVGHMVSETDVTVGRAAWGLITSRFRIDRHRVEDARQRGVEGLVLTLAGRFAPLDQLKGNGMATLRMRADALRGQ
jgi:uncharacterized protein (TIGR03083 family)